MRRLAVLAWLCAFLIAAAYVTAFEWLLALATDVLSPDGDVSAQGRRQLAGVLLGAAVLAALAGVILAALGVRRWRAAVEAVVHWDALRLSGRCVPDAHRVLAWSLGLGLLIVAVWRLHDRMGWLGASLFRKEGPLENATFVLELASAALCACAAARSRAREQGFPAAAPILYALCAATLFIVGMEEINWGQTLLGFDTPARWAAVNHQQETSVHNLLDRDTLTATARVAAMMFGPAVLMLVPAGVRAPASVLGTIAPPASLVPLALLIAVAGLSLHPEVIELLLSIFFAFYGYRLYLATRCASHAPHAAARPALRPGSWLAKRFAPTAIRALVAIGLVAALLARVDWMQLPGQIARVSPLALVGALLLMLLGLVASAWKWSLSLQMHALHFRFPYLLRALMAGFFFNNFLPTAIGGDAYRVLRTLPREHYRSRALSAIAVERAMGLLVLLALGGLGALALIDRFDAARAYCATLLTAALAGLAGLVALERGWLRAIAQRWHAARRLDAVRHNLMLLHDRRRDWLVLAAASLVFQAISIGVIFLLLDAAGASATWAQCALIAAVVGLSAILPLSINGLGIMEGTFVAMAVMLDIGYEHALIAAFARRFVALLLGACCGVVYLVEIREEAADARFSLAGLVHALRQGGVRGLRQVVVPTRSCEADVSLDVQRGRCDESGRGRGADPLG